MVILYACAKRFSANIVIAHNNDNLIAILVIYYIKFLKLHWKAVVDY